MKYKTQTTMTSEKNIESLVVYQITMMVFDIYDKNEYSHDSYTSPPSDSFEQCLKHVIEYVKLNVEIYDGDAFNDITPETIVGILNDWAFNNKVILSFKPYSWQLDISINDKNNNNKNN
jgi:hypothetical protein